MTSQCGKQTPKYIYFQIFYIFNQTTKLGQLIEYNIPNILHETHTQNGSLDQQSEML